MIPSYLYHYTSLETLKLILKNRTIRFKRIDLMNDPLEGQIAGYGLFRIPYFISSWTATKIDEIPMWLMSTNLQGVRLRLPIDLFCFGVDLQIKKYRDSFQIFTQLDKKYCIKNHVIFDENSPNKSLFIDKVFGPIKINYTDDKTEIGKNSIFTSKDVNTPDFLEIEPFLAFSNKGSQWEYEKEFRFALSPSIKIISRKENLFQNNLMAEIESEYIDVLFNPSALANLEILFGPKVDKKSISEISAILENNGISGYNLLRSTIEMR